VKKPRLENHLVSVLLRDRPKLIEAVHGSPGQYRRAVEFIHAPPKGCTVLQLAPPDTLATTRTSRDRSKLELDYELGRSLAMEVVERWKA
jgi:predicted patatin/cPLA2 family phospholipase